MHIFLFKFVTGIEMVMEMKMETNVMEKKEEEGGKKEEE